MEIIANLYLIFFVTREQLKDSSRQHGVLEVVGSNPAIPTNQRTPDKIYYLSDMRWCLLTSNLSGFAYVSLIVGYQ